MDTSNKTKKRSRSDSDCGTETVNFPRFLIIQSRDPNKPLKLSPFAINKGVESIVGTAKSIKRLRSGDVLVEVDRAGQSSKLLKMETFVNTPVKVSAHKTLNSCKGVVRCPELRDCDCQEILDELSDQQVTDVHRVMINQNGVKKPTNTLFLTFNRTSIPQYIKVGYLLVKVTTYIPNPIRCFKCQRFGHFRSNCKNNECCEKCGSEDHNVTNCENTAKCVNCDGSHSANSRSCPKWIEEKKIQEIKVMGNVTYPEARKLFQSQQSQITSYANIAKRTTEMTTLQPKAAKTKVSVVTQTELTWIKGDTPVLSEINKAINTDQSKPQTEKQGQQKKAQAKTKDVRRSRSLTREPSVKTNPSSNQTKKQAVKGKVQLNVGKSKFDTVITQNKFDILDVEDEEMEVSPIHQPSSKIKVIPRKDNT